MRTRTSRVIAGLVFFGLAAPSLPAAQRNAAPDLPAMLANLLRNLDSDQSRKLTRLIKPDQSAYSQMPLAEVAQALNAHQGRALVVIGRRGSVTESPVDVEQVLAVSSAKPARVSNAATSRTPFQPRSSPPPSWSSVLRTSAIADVQKEVSAQAAFDALTTSRSAAFVFLLAPQGASVEQLIVVPDTVNITIRGNAATGEYVPPPPPDDSFE